MRSARSLNAGEEGPVEAGPSVLMGQMAMLMEPSGPL